MLLALPEELLAAILSCLSPNALLAAAAASRLLARIVAASSRLQYTIALAKHRLLDIHPSAQNPPYAARLRLLTDRENAWSSLRWKARHTLKLPPTGSVYEFVGGIYGNGREDDNRITASISFLELPTSSSDPSRPLRTWTHPMGDVTIIDFTMDPSQDLLVLVAVAPLDSKYIYNLHLRTISTNEPHPRAPLPILHCLDRHPSNPPHHELFAAVRVQVSGYLVGLLIKEAPDPIGAHLQIWNWENDPYYPCSMSSQHGIDDFTFLSRSAFLTVLPVGQFVVYSFPDPLVSPTHPSRPGCEPVKMYMYEFPELTNGYIYWYISMSCNPAPGYVPCQGDRAMDPFPNSASMTTPDTAHRIHHFYDPTKQQLYYPLPDERIHACCIYIFNPNHQPTNLTGHNNNGIPTNSNNTTSTAAATGGPTQNTPLNPSFLTDDELDEENQQVHSFVFFMNLKNLLDPPDEWFHWQDKKKTTTSTTKMGDPPPCLSAIGYSDNPGGLSLESSLNALKRSQEEKELHDAKAGGSGHEKGKKKIKTGNSSSSLSVEIPIGGSSARSNSMVTRSKSLLSSSSSSMMATTTTTAPTRASSSTSLTYPPFPTFSSPLSTNGSPFDAENISRASSLDEVEDIIMAASESPSSATSPLTKSSNGQSISSRSNTIVTPYSNAIASTSSAPSPASASILHTNNTTTSSNKTRSTSTPPTYTSNNHNHYDHSNSSSSLWHNHLHHYQDVNYPGGFAPSPSSSSSSIQTLPFPHNSPGFSANQERSTNRQQKQDIENSTASATFSSSSTANTPKKLQETPVPWEVWGPSSTRWFEECLSTDWQHAIYGLRTVESVSVRERERMMWMEPREKRRDANGASNAAFQEAAKQKEQKERSVDTTKGKGKARGWEDLPDDDNEQEVLGTDQGKDLIKGGILGKDNDDEIFQQALMDQGRNGIRPKLKGDKNPDIIHIETPDNATAGTSTTTTTYPTLSHSPQNTDNGTGMLNGVQTTMTSASSSSSLVGSPVRSKPRRFLRVRDFNPYSLRQAEAEVEMEMRTSNGDWRMAGKGKGKQREMCYSFSPLPISPTTKADMMPLPSSSYSYPFPIHLNVNSNFSNCLAPNSNPFSRSSTTATHSSSADLNGATDRVQWGKRRVVREPSITPVRGVFKRDVVSWLPYTEVVSEETFEVTDVMMDDCRLLLLKVRLNLLYA